MEDHISIIIANYNKENFIIRCLNSIVKQTYKNYEILIVDDCSTDNSKNIIKEFKNNNHRISIKLFELSKNYGPSYARNYGIIESKNNFITFIDSDDYWEENFLLEMLKTANQSKVNLVYCDYKIHRKQSIKNFITPPQVTYSQMLTKSYISSSSFLLKIKNKKYFFLNNLQRAEDLHFFLSILKDISYAIKCMNTSSNITKLSNSQSSNKLKTLLSRFFVYKELKINYILIMYYLLMYIFLLNKK